MKKRPITENYDMDFKSDVNDALGELFESLMSLREEYVKVMNINSILINSNKALKNLLVSKKILTEKEIEKAYTKELDDLKNQYHRHMEVQNQLYLEHLLNSASPGHS